MNFFQTSKSFWKKILNPRYSLTKLPVICMILFSLASSAFHWDCFSRFVSVFQIPHSSPHSRYPSGLCMCTFNCTLHNLYILPCSFHLCHFASRFGLLLISWFYWFSFLSLTLFVTIQSFHDFQILVPLMQLSL